MNYLLFFTIGAVFGSFFNVVIYRLPRGKSIVKPPSSCPSCENRIKMIDNIPILSFLILGGRCRYCGEPISIRYPLVELLGGLIFAVSFAVDGLTPMFVRDVLFFSLLLLVSFIDADTRIIPDSLSLGGLAAGFLLEAFLLGKGWKYPLAGALAGGGILFFTAFTYEKITKREGLGGGDVKLLGAVGAFTGYTGAIMTIFAGSVVGTLYGIFIMIREKGGLKTAIPFGPFLAFGAFLSDILIRNFGPLF